MIADNYLHGMSSTNLSPSGGVHLIERSVAILYRTRKRNEWDIDKLEHASTGLLLKKLPSNLLPSGWKYTPMPTIQISSTYSKPKSHLIKLKQINWLQKSQILPFIDA